MQPPAAILVDLDDTLLDGSGLAGALERTCAVIGAELGIDARQLLSSNQAAWADYWPIAERDWRVGGLDGAALSREVWTRALLACGCTSTRAVERAIEAHAAHTRGGLRLYDDVPRFFTRLAARVPLGLVSNGARDTQRQRLAWFDLEQHFRVVAISGELGMAKPDPAIFAFAVAELALPAEAVWHVGDNLASDVAGARAAGMGAVWLNRSKAVRGPRDPLPDLEVSSLDQLAAAAGF